MNILLVCSHGGHFMEMLQLLEAFEGHKILWATYDSERTREFAKTNLVYLCKNIGTSPWRLFLSIFWVFRIFFKERPQLIVSTGSEIALSFFYLAKLFGIKTVFVESVCRVKTPSKTGKLVYPVADRFFVQWEQLLKVYGPKARFEGGIL